MRDLQRTLAVRALIGITLSALARRTNSTRDGNDFFSLDIVIRAIPGTCARFVGVPPRCEVVPRGCSAADPPLQSGGSARWADIWQAQRRQPALVHCRDPTAKRFGALVRDIFGRCLAEDQAASQLYLIDRAHTAPRWDTCGIAPGNR